jgi:hypothetical protein
LGATAIFAVVHVSGMPRTFHFCMPEPVPTSSSKESLEQKVDSIHVSMESFIKRIAHIIHDWAAMMNNVPIVADYWVYCLSQFIDLGADDQKKFFTAPHANSDITYRYLEKHDGTRPEVYAVKFPISDDINMVQREIAMSLFLNRFVNLAWVNTHILIYDEVKGRFGIGASKDRVYLILTHYLTPIQ